MVEGADHVLNGAREEAVVVREGRRAQRLEAADVPRLERDLPVADADEVARTVGRRREQRREDVAGLGETVGERLPEQRLRSARVARLHAPLAERETARARSPGLVAARTAASSARIDASTTRATERACGVSSGMGGVSSADGVGRRDSR